MTIKVGDKLPAGTLSEFIEVEGNGCSVGPNPFKVEDLTKGRKVVIFGLPGAFTPTCSAKHVPSYVANLDKLKAKNRKTNAPMEVGYNSALPALLALEAMRDQKMLGWDPVARKSTPL